MGVLYLTESDVADLLTMPMALAAVEESFAKLAVGEAENIPRARSKAPGAILHSMSAAAGYMGVAGWKHYTTTRAGARFLVGLSSTANGELLALIEADRLGQMRTGAASGVAMRCLAPSDASRVGVIGAGWQAEAQLRAACHALPIVNAAVYSRAADKREAFAARMCGALSAELSRTIQVRAVSSPEEAVVDMPVVVTATNSAQPVFRAESLANDALVCAMGSNWPKRTETPPEAIRRAALVVCDQIIACQREAGDLLVAEAAGMFAWDRAVELSAVVAGTIEPPAGPIVFKSVGLALEDVAVGWRLVEQARALGRGTLLPI
jgi:ornithine cyclodeaminase/alanine dehydrogenase-like protein (mu-crystallin family)